MPLSFKHCLNCCQCRSVSSGVSCHSFSLSNSPVFSKYRYSPHAKNASHNFSSSFFISTSLVLFYPTLCYFSILYRLFVILISKRRACMKPLKNKVSITLDADIIDRIKELAEEDDRSFSQYINLVLREHIKSLDKSE